MATAAERADGEPTTSDADVDAGGLLLVDKPAGITSHDVVAIVRRALGTRRVGHTGTLDPFATGLLVVLIGRGTRLIPYVDGEPKVYEATIRFGAETDTDDGTGAMTRDGAAAVGRLRSPPRSRAHRRRSTRCRRRIRRSRSTARARTHAARRGAPLELAPARVTVHDWTILATQRRRSRRAHHVRRRHVHSRARARSRPTHGQRGAPRRAAAHRAAAPFDVATRSRSTDLRDGEFDAARRCAPAIPSLPVQRLDAASSRRVSHGNADRRARRDWRRASRCVDDEETLIAIAERDGGAACEPQLVLRDA